MLRLIFIIFIIFFTTSCSKGLLDGNNEKNLKKLDEVYGKCNNPARQMNRIEKNICLDKQRAAGPDGIVGEPLNITELIERFKNGSSSVTYSSTTNVNSNLWSASLLTLEDYSIEISDSTGGFISTDWILNKVAPNQRCKVKINVTSKELLSNGVKVKILCEEKIEDNWYADEKIYTEQEKNITLKILEIANQLKKSEESS